MDFDFRKAKITAKNFLKENNTKFMVFIAASSTVMAVYSALKAGPKFEEIRKKRREEVEVLKARRVTPGLSESDYRKERAVTELIFLRDSVKVLWPSGAFTAISLYASAKGYKMSLARETALRMAYTGSEVALSELRDKAKEIIGENKLEKVQDEIVKDHIEEACVDESVKRTDDPLDNDYPCFDEWSGRYFKSTRQKIEKALLRASAKCQREIQVPMNFIYGELDQTGRWLPISKSGSDFGFDVDMLDNGEIPVRFTTYEHEVLGPVLAVVLEPSII